MEDNFFPTQDYSIPPSPSNYMKFQEGENTFRVLSSAIVGWEYWNKDNKPVRSETKWDELPSDIKTDKEGKARINHFWAFAVWNYEAKDVQILQITQKGIMSAIKALVDNKKWGNPKKYDITVTRTGEGFDTEYSTMPNPHSEIALEILETYKNKPVNLKALFDGGDPFAK